MSNNIEVPQGTTPQALRHRLGDYIGTFTPALVAIGSDGKTYKPGKLTDQQAACCVAFLADLEKETICQLPGVSEKYSVKLKREGKTAFTLTLLNDKKQALATIGGVLLPTDGAASRLWSDLGIVGPRPRNMPWVAAVSHKEPLVNGTVLAHPDCEADRARRDDSEGNLARLYFSALAGPLAKAAALSEKQGRMLVDKFKEHVEDTASQSRHPWLGCELTVPDKNGGLRNCVVIGVRNDDSGKLMIRALPIIPAAKKGPCSVKCQGGCIDPVRQPPVDIEILPGYAKHVIPGQRLKNSEIREVAKALECAKLLREPDMRKRESCAIGMFARAVLECSLVKRIANITKKVNGLGGLGRMSPAGASVYPARSV